MSKRHEKLNVNIQAHDVEFSDPELREIEELDNDLGDLKDLEDEEIDLDDLEREINKMDEGDVKNKEKPIKVHQEDYIQQKFSNETFEQEYHSPEYFFGNALEIELEKMIPNLKKQYENKVDEADFLIALNKKEINLMKFKMTIETKVQKGEINEIKYIQILQKVHDKNKMVYQKAISDKVPKSVLARISDRIVIISSEIKEVKEGIESTLHENNKTQHSKNPVPGMSNSTQANISVKVNNSIKSDAFLQVSEQTINLDIKCEPIHPAIAHFANKISIHVSFLNYLEKYFPTEREKDIKELQDKIDRMKTSINDLNKNPETADIAEIDKLFPNMDSTFIIGMKRTERNKIIEDIFAEINSELKSLKSPQMIETYKNHYKPIIAKLVEVRDSPLGCLPVIKKKTISVPTAEFNKHIEKGDMLFQLKSIKLPKSDRYFYISIAFKYGDRDFKETFNYNDKNGNFNTIKVFKLEEGKILKKFIKETVTFQLYKRKMIFSSRFVSSQTVKLEKFKNYCDLPVKLEFPYKENKVLCVDVEFSINKALENSLKDLFFYIIEKQFPPFKITTPKQTNDDEMKKSENPPSDVSKASTCYQSGASVQTKNTSVEQKGPTANPNVQKKTNFVSKYKFPILKASDAANLVAIIAKNKIDEIYGNFQLATFCVTFLEEFETEIEKQIGDFAEEGDTNSRKKAEELMMTASKYKGFLESNLGNGKMSQNDYKSKIEAFLKLDNQFLTFFEKNGFAQAAYYVKNRIEIIEGEIKQFKEMGVE